jgi:hypothetical protein
VLIVVLALQWGDPEALPRLRGRATLDAHPVRHAMATWFTAAALVYLSAVILLRPWR